MRAMNPTDGEEEEENMGVVSKKATQNITFSLVALSAQFLRNFVVTFRGQAKVKVSLSDESIPPLLDVKCR